MIQVLHFVLSTNDTISDLVNEPRTLENPHASRSIRQLQVRRLVLLAVGRRVWSDDSGDDASVTRRIPPCIFGRLTAADPTRARSPGIVRELTARAHSVDASSNVSLVDRQLEAHSGLGSGGGGVGGRDDGLILHRYPRATKSNSAIGQLDDVTLCGRDPRSRLRQFACQQPAFGKVTDQTTTASIGSLTPACIAARCLRKVAK